jgi:hypothetical protein
VDGRQRIVAKHHLLDESLAAQSAVSALAVAEGEDPSMSSTTRLSIEGFGADSCETVNLFRNKLCSLLGVQFEKISARFEKDVRRPQIMYPLSDAAWRGNAVITAPNAGHHYLVIGCLDGQRIQVGQRSLIVRASNPDFDVSNIVRAKPQSLQEAKQLATRDGLRLLADSPVAG